MENAFKEKADQLFTQIITDARWNINDEMLFNVFGFTYYGYCFALGNAIHFLDPSDINQYVEDKLISLGAGKKYVTGMIEYAASTFTEQQDDVYAQLVDIGFSHIASDGWTTLIDSIFTNAQALASKA